MQVIGRNRVVRARTRSQRRDENSHRAAPVYRRHHIARQLHPAAAPVASDQDRQRYIPITWQARLFALANFALIAAVTLFVAFFTWRAAQPPAPPIKPLTLIAIEPLAAPPEPVREVPEGPEQVEQIAQKQREDRPEPPKPPLPRIEAPLPPPPLPQEQAHAADPVPQTTAPKSLPAPPARQMVSDADASWEAQLLAHLEKYRRYPSVARRRGEQGVAYVTFRMNRAGRVLSVDLARSSGSAKLDRAALETIQRAQPLPAIPEGRADILSLSVPVEFFVR